MFTRKIETIPFREFLRQEDHTKNEKSLQPTLPLYGFLGLDSTFSSFNAPYTVVFLVGGVLILSTIIEHTLLSRGHERIAERLQTTVSFIMPICFYAFLVFGVVKVLL